MRLFALATITASCGMLAAAAPATGNASIGDSGVSHSNRYNNTQPVHSHKSETITLALSTTGINVGDSKTLYHDVQAAIEHICPPQSTHCSNAHATFSVYTTSRGLSIYTNSHVRKTITVSVQDSYWGGRPDVYEVLRNTVAAAFERGTYDPANCVHALTVYIGGKRQMFRDCMTLDYAEVFLSGGYKMKVRFGGPRSQYEDLKYDCEKVVDDAFMFVRDDVQWKGTPWVYCLGVELWPRV
ncbi:hypothetical protein ACET3X_003310 [Alternaria dauci]|uniref:Ecp2 effector protein domain-containing protein n=1 Tax=Alternaria dauci TaxID=48095 RepID=A0ABR3UT55_9PLEO